MSAVITALAPLRDIVGVQGTLLVAGGRVVARDLAGVPADACELAAARLDTMLATVGENFEPVDTVTLGFDGHDLFVRRSGDLAVLVVARANTNVEALKMATKLALRRIPAAMAAPGPSETSGIAATGNVRAMGDRPSVTPVERSDGARPTQPGAAKPERSVAPDSVKKKKNDIWG